MKQATHAPPWMATLLATQRDIAALAAAWSSTALGQTSATQFQRLLIEQYRRLLAPPESPAAVAGTGVASAALLRYQAAAGRFAELLAAIANDAGRRLASALNESGADAAPITTLRELHAVWIECGEAAWSAAAHGEAFATAQAELLVALVELRAAGSPG